MTPEERERFARAQHNAYIAGRHAGAVAGALAGFLVGLLLWAVTLALLHWVK